MSVPSGAEAAAEATAPPPLSPLDRLRPLADRMTAWRHDLHAHPELGFEEQRTADHVASVLETAGIAVARIAGTGVVGTLRSGTSSRAIGLRADMDALPIAEQNRFAHVSRNPGVMHACGHDGHVAMLLGAAVQLARAPRFDGTIHFVFQPAEEGRGGAHRLVAEGFFARFPMQAIHGLHNWPDLPLGTFAVHGGPVMAACDVFALRIRGRGGHAAQPHRTIDPVLVAGHLITAIQSLVSRTSDPFDSVVVSVTRMETGLATNVISDEVTLHGTIRSFAAAARTLIHDGLRRLAEHGAAAFGATAEVTFESLAPATINDPSEADRAALAAACTVGSDRVRRDLRPSMTAEDFGVLLGQMPGSYVWLGTGPSDPAVPRPGLHDPAYDFADDALAIGAAYWVALAEMALAPER